MTNVNASLKIMVRAKKIIVEILAHAKIFTKIVGI